MFKYSSKILFESIKGKINNILPKQNKSNKKSYDIKMFPWGFFNIFNTKIKQESFQNHACFHLDHLFIADDGKIVAIDWEHSVKSPDRYAFLDDAYFFQDLLAKKDEKMAVQFLGNFIHKNWFNENIRKVFIKKLLWWIYEILTEKKDIDFDSNQEKISLYQKYIEELLKTDKNIPWYNNIKK